MPELHEWEKFYVIVGSSAGALIGLQFVVMTLVAVRPPKRAGDAAAAFATPNIVHFCAVLLLAVLLCAPWHAIEVPAALWGLMGFGGVIYSMIVARRMNTQTAYRPGFEDWLFHAVLPFSAYLLLAGLYFAIQAHMREVLFGVGAATLLLLFSRYSQRLGRRYLPYFCASSRQSRQHVGTLQLPGQRRSPVPGIWGPLSYRRGF